MFYAHFVIFRPAPATSVALNLTNESQMVKHFIHETREIFSKLAKLNAIEQIERPEHLEHPEQIERS